MFLCARDQAEHMMGNGEALYDDWVVHAAGGRDTQLCVRWPCAFLDRLRIEGPQGDCC